MEDGLLHRIGGSYLDLAEMAYQTVGMFGK